MSEIHFNRCLNLNVKRNVNVNVNLNLNKLNDLMWFDWNRMVIQFVPHIPHSPCHTTSCYSCTFHQFFFVPWYPYFTKNLHLASHWMSLIGSVIQRMTFPSPRIPVERSLHRERIVDPWLGNRFDLYWEQHASTILQRAVYSVISKTSIFLTWDCCEPVINICTSNPVSLV
jgi:hypothetical protein